MARRKFSIKGFNIKIQRKPPTLNDRLVGGFGGAGGSLVLSGILFYLLFPSYPRSIIPVEEVIGLLLLTTAFFVWVTDKNKKPNAKK